MKKINSQHLRDCLVAIESVKSEVKAAMDRDDSQVAYSRMGDLVALEVCMCIEAEKLLNELDILFPDNKTKKAA